MSGQFESVKSDKAGDYEQGSVLGAVATEPSSQPHEGINGICGLIVITMMNNYGSKMVTVCEELCFD